MHEELFERTKCTLLRHLQDLNDQAEAEGGRIRDPEVLDGLKDCVRTLRWLREMEEAAPARTAGRL